MFNFTYLLLCSLQGEVTEIITNGIATLASSVSLAQPNVLQVFSNQEYLQKYGSMFDGKNYLSFVLGNPVEFENLGTKLCLHYKYL